jgi:hypothetical protein
MAGRIIGLLVAVVMFCFSGFMYFNSGDWVAAVFALGSLGYFLFFLTTYPRIKP